MDSTAHLVQKSLVPIVHSVHVLAALNGTS